VVLVPSLHDVETAPDFDAFAAKRSSSEPSPSRRVSGQMGDIIGEGEAFGSRTA
jgi:hypothetical protein